MLVIHDPVVVEVAADVSGGQIDGRDLEIDRMREFGRQVRLKRLLDIPGDIELPVDGYAIRLGFGQLVEILCQGIDHEIEALAQSSDLVLASTGFHTDVQIAGVHDFHGGIQSADPSGEQQRAAKKAQKNQEDASEPVERVPLQERVDGFKERGLGYGIDHEPLGFGHHRPRDPVFLSPWNETGTGFEFDFLPSFRSAVIWLMNSLKVLVSSGNAVLSSGLEYSLSGLPMCSSLVLARTIHESLTMANRLELKEDRTASFWSFSREHRPAMRPSSAVPSSWIGCSSAAS